MLERLKVVIAKVMPEVDTKNVTENSKLTEDLGFDSLAIMMLSINIENEFNIRFTEQIFFETVGDVCKYIESKIQ